jgi:DNA gyrase inhibitor GyrI
LNSGKVELYDIDNDPSESKDLSGISPDLMNKMLTKLVRWRSENNVPLPSASPVNTMHDESNL